mgnify:CR=1 FL=1
MIMANEVTVVMINAFRPDNVRKLIEHYAAMPLVSRVIVADVAANYSNTTEVSGSWLKLPEKLMWLRIHPDPGMYLRFTAATLAQTSAVLIVDDDIMVPAHTVRMLFTHWQSAPEVLHGLVGRNPDIDIPDGYTIDKAYGDVQIVLTRCVMMSAGYLGPVLDISRRIVPVLPGEPGGNGEDIVLSYVAMRESRFFNKVHKLPYEDMDAKSPVSISVRFAAHLEQRKAVLKWCRLNLVMPSKIKKLIDAVHP